MKRILVTGGAGFIGAHICLLLLEKGFEVVVIDSFVNSSIISLDRVLSIMGKTKSSMINKLLIIKGDIRNKNDITKAFERSIKENKPIEAVIHLAGLKSVRESFLKPFCYWDNNLIGSINLLNIMEKFNCRNIVFSSSATVYKYKLNEKLIENDICEPVNPYGETKLAVEKFLKDVYKSAPSKWRIASLRYFNPVGSHFSGLIGEDPLEDPNNLFPRLTRVASGKLEKLKIFGSDWSTPDGTCIRDYIHIMDLADGHFSALNYLINNEPQIITINLGTGRGTSVLQLIKIFEKVNNVVIPFSFEDRRSGDIAFVVADNSLAKLILNWTPKRNIENMCIDGWNWQLKNPEGYF